MEKEFTIKVKMEERWIDAFCSFLSRMQYNGKIGHSEIIGFYSDGDGDFRPIFDFGDLTHSEDINYREPYIYSTRNSAHIFDAG